MEEIMNKQNGLYHMTETSMVVGPIEKITCKEMAIAIIDLLT